MNVNKISGTSTGRDISKPAANTPQVQNKPSVSPAVSRNVTSPQAPLSSMITALGLPLDKLSASIVSLARFFSLPVKPENMAAIRRLAFTQPTADSETAKQTAAESKSGSLPTVKNREVFSLTAAAAESKGVELQPRGLQAFAEAVDPEWQKRNEQDGQNRRQRGKNQNEKDEEKTSAKSGGITDITASSLEKMALEAAEKNPLLFMLNKLPGKNGQRWIVLPFDFSENGREFRLAMRILLEDTKYTIQNRSVFMALDIIETGNDENRFSFALEAANNQVNRITVFTQSDINLKTELSNIFGLPVDRIFIKNNLDSSLAETDRAEYLYSIDEAV